MNKKGFTLVELLITIAIVGVIAAIASYGVIGVSNLIKNNLVTAKRELLLSGAESFGEDHQYTLTDTCTIDGATLNQCRYIKVSILYDEYISTTSECEAGPCFKHDVTGLDMHKDVIVIYKRNNRVYAQFDKTYSDDPDEYNSAPN